jgi:hypothetical protein
MLSYTLFAYKDKGYGIGHNTIKINLLQKLIVTEVAKLCPFKKIRFLN